MQPTEQIETTAFSCHRLVIMGRLLIPRALHIGTGQASIFTDAAIRRNQKGQPYIPGSTFAGLLRSTAEDFAPYLCADAEVTIRRLFGRAREDEAQREDIGASRLFVEDSHLCEQLPADIEVRDYVGIDRRRAAARAHLQYDREVTPSNTSYTFELCLEEPTPEEVRLLLAVLDFWSVYGVQLGGRTTTGLGEARVDRSHDDSLQFYCFNFKRHDVLRSFLLDGGNRAEHIPIPNVTKTTRAVLANWINEPEDYSDNVPPLDEFFRPQHLFLTLDLALDEPLLIKGNIPEVPNLPEEDRPDEASASSERTSDAEFITALEWRDGALKPGFYIPGSSLKGVLRTRAEKIIRTLNFYRSHADLKAAEDDPDAEREYETHIAACAVTHPDDLTLRLKACFGARDRQRTAQSRNAKSKYQHSCLTCRLFGNSIMRGRLTCSDAAPVTTLAPKLFDHVAIDRFTGGAADAKKFDTRPLMPIANPDTTVASAFRFTIHIERLELWMIGLLGHLLKDLGSGDIRIGHATRRGYGRVRGRVAKAVFLALPGTELFNTCRSHDIGLNVENKFAVYGPHKEIDVSDDWSHIFSATPWDGAEAAQTLRDSIGGKLLTAADRAFQARVREAEEQVEVENFGEFHDDTDDSER